MGQRGPAPKPTATKILEGTFRPDRAARNEPTPRALSAVELQALRPVWLAGDAGGFWDANAPQLAALGVLTAVDVPVFVGLCLSYARALEAEETLAQEGLTITTDKGFVLQHPAVSIARQEWSQVARLAAQYGLTPSGRSRVSAVPPAPDATPPAPDDRTPPTSNPRTFLFGHRRGA